MKCYLVDGKGIDSMKQADRPIPKVLNDTDVLVDIKACSLNFRDLKVAKGQYRPGDYPPYIPLSDMSGTVRAVGDKVTEFKIGDRVLNAPFRNWPAGKLNPRWAHSYVGVSGVDGVLAEQIVYPADALVHIPAHLDFNEASTFTVAGLTAWSAVVVHGKTRPGEWVLIHGTGGVSIFAAQLAHALGAKTIVTTSSKEKGDYVKKNYGVTATVNYKDADWDKQLKALTDGEGVDVVVDVVGGETLSRSIHICNYSARVAVIGVLGGSESPVKTLDLLIKQVQVQGIYMESAQELKALMHAVDTIKLKPAIDSVFAFDKAIDAFKHLESQKHLGKIVISI